MKFEILDDPQAPADATAPAASCAITEYNETAAALATLSEKYGKVVFDVSTKAGLESAKTARAELRGYRVNLESMRKNIKAPALERCRLIDAEAQDITAKLTALEKPIAAQIEAEESRKEAEKQAKLQAEIQRVTKLRERIAAFTQLVDTIKPTSDACQEAIVRMKAIPIDDTFEELQPDAQQAKDAALFRLQNLFAQYTASEAEAEQIRKDREELAKLQEEAAARRAEDDRRAAEERTRLAAEQEAQLVEERRKAAQIAEAEREAQAKRNREIEAQQAEQRRQQEERARRVREEQEAEQRRLDAQKVELERQQAEVAAAERARLAAANEAEERVRDAAPKMLATLRETQGNLLAILENNSLPEELVLREWLGIAGDAIKAAGINYFAKDGTLMNADGTRSIFDDVDQ